MAKPGQEKFPAGDGPGSGPGFGAVGFSRQVRHELVERDLSVSDLADSIGYPVSTVSRAINHGVFPHVRRAILVHLGFTAN